MEDDLVKSEDIKSVLMKLEVLQASSTDGEAKILELMIEPFRQLLACKMRNAGEGLKLVNGGKASPEDQDV